MPTDTPAADREPAGATDGADVTCTGVHAREPAAAARPADRAGRAAAGLIDVARLRAALLRLSRRLRKHEVADLTPTQLSALATVARDGPLKLGDLAAAERIAPSTLTRLVSALEERGLRGARAGPRRRPGQPALGHRAGHRRCCDRIRQETTSLLADNLLTLPA